MSEATASFAPELRRWAETFAADARVFCAIVDETRLPPDVRKVAAGALNYLLLQLVPPVRNRGTAWVPSRPGGKARRGRIAVATQPRSNTAAGDGSAAKRGPISDGRH